MGLDIFFWLLYCWFNMLCNWFIVIFGWNIVGMVVGLLFFGFWNEVGGLWCIVGNGVGLFVDSDECFFWFDRERVFVVCFIWVEVVVVVCVELFVVFIGKFVDVEFLCLSCFVLDFCNLIFLLDKRYKNIVCLDCFIFKFCKVFWGLGIFLFIIYFCIWIGKLYLLNI